ncbi:MAG: endolytic transglycosylase MltG [Clostridia bacterium]
MEEKRNVKRRRSHALLVIIIIIILIAASLMLASYLYVTSRITNKMTDTPKSISFDVPKGTSTKAIASSLEEAGILNDAEAFLLYLRFSEGDEMFLAGDYQLTTNMPYGELSQALSTRPKEETVRFTIPEGFKVEQVAKKLSQQGLIDQEIFLELCRKAEFDYDFIEKKKFVEYPLEGFLFPDTYEIYTKATEKEIIEKMLANFAQKIEPFRTEIAKQKKTVYETMIMASIVEREAKVKADRKPIAGVFYKRLEIGMPLESCATIQFLFDEPKARLLYSDLEIESPYNSYLNKGLPPGPIASPGVDAIEAAVYPEKNDYLFFLAKGDGSHVFSKTLAEHNAAKQKYIN